MNILILGARDGILTRNLMENLSLVRDGKLRSHAALNIGSLIACDADADLTQWANYAREADFVFDLSDDAHLGDTLLAFLQRENPSCSPVRVFRKENISIHEGVLLRHGETTGTKVYQFQIPELFGKWDNTNEQTAVSTLCRMAATGRDYSAACGGAQRELLYVNDLVDLLLDVLAGKMEPAGKEHIFCKLLAPYYTTTDEIVGMLKACVAQTEKQIMPEIPAGSFANKLFSTYLSYLPEEKICYPLELRVTDGGEQFRVMSTEKTGQITINRYKPGTTLGLHWHNTKWEQYMVISGRGLVRQRKVGTDDVLEFEVTGAPLLAVQMIPGYVHSITNLSETEDLVILIWASEVFNPRHPDTNPAEI